MKKEAHIEMVQEKKRERRRREVGYGRDLDILKNNLLPKRFIKRDVMCRRLYCCARQQLFLHHSALKKMALKCYTDNNTFGLGQKPLYKASLANI